MSYLSEIKAQVESLFAHVEAQTHAFSKSSGLNCPPQCGKCCEFPDIHATVLDMIPMADHILSEEKNIEITESSRCVFFTDLGNGKGFCGQYQYRPSTCRLFGYATQTNRSGQRELGACQILKAQKSIGSLDLTLAPTYDSASRQLIGIDPNMGAELLPINKALKKAIDVVRLHRSFKD